MRRARWTRAVAALCALPVLFAACGGTGPLDAAALDQQAATLHGLAGEGAVLATATERGDLPGPFRRVHARELADAAGVAASALGAEVADERLRDRQRRLHADAMTIAEAFIVLAAPAVDPGEARRANQAFERTATSTS